MRRTSIAHEFVEFIPSELQEDTLYVSIPYATAVHKCACGCGNKVVTPISPIDWQLRFDGDTVSLTPSIGNWQFPCRSHYWIMYDTIRWDGAWTDQQIAAGRRREAGDRERYFAHRRAANSIAEQMGDDRQVPRRVRKSLLARALHWLGRS